MSIAVSAKVVSSASWFVTVAVLAIATALLGMLISLGVFGQLSPTFSMTIGFFSVLASAWG